MDERERERERERETNIIMREERENNLIFVATCYSELLLLTVHCNKLVKYFKLSNIVVGVLLFVWSYKITKKLS